MNDLQKKILITEKELEHLKFSHEIDRSFIIAAFNQNIAQQLAFFAGAITILQIDSVQKSEMAILAVIFVAAALIFAANMNYRFGTSKLQANIKDISSKIDQKYSYLLSLLNRK